jgi:hypothetical protein
MKSNLVDYLRAQWDLYKLYESVKNLPVPALIDQCDAITAEVEALKPLNGSFVLGLNFTEVLDRADTIFAKRAAVIRDSERYQECFLRCSQSKVLKNTTEARSARWSRDKHRDCFVGGNVPAGVLMAFGTCLSTLATTHGLLNINRLVQPASASDVTLFDFWSSPLVIPKPDAAAVSNTTQTTVAKFIAQNGDQFTAGLIPLVVDMKKRHRTHGKITQKAALPYQFAELCGAASISQFFDPVPGIRTTVFGAEPKMLNSKASAMPYRGLTSLLTACRGHLMVLLCEPSLCMSHPNIETFLATASFKQLSHLPVVLLHEGDALYVPFGWVMVVVACPVDLDIDQPSTLTEGAVVMCTVDLHLRRVGEHTVGHPIELVRHVLSQWVACEASIPPTYLKIPGVVEWRAALEAAAAESVADVDGEDLCLLS